LELVALDPERQVGDEVVGGSQPRADY
jgi:hypothetical protein